MFVLAFRSTNLFPNILKRLFHLLELLFLVDAQLGLYKVLQLRQLS